MQTATVEAAAHNRYTRPLAGSGRQPGINLELLFFFSGEAGIDTLSELLARLEMRHMLGCKCHRFTCLRVSPDTRRTVMQGETAKPPDFYPLPA